MNCPNCGAEATPGLNYCKRCGGGLNQLMSPLEVRPAVSIGTAWAIGLTTVFLLVGGLAVLFGSIIDIVHSGMPPHVIIWLAAFGSGTLLGGVVLLLLFWMRLLKASPRGVGGGPMPLNSFVAPHELGAARAAAVPSPHSAASITEHTTRIFEPSYREPPK